MKSQRIVFIRTFVGQRISLNSIRLDALKLVDKTGYPWYVPTAVDLFRRRLYRMSSICQFLNKIWREFSQGT